jgi:hypothetical protein
VTDASELDVDAMVDVRVARGSFEARVETRAVEETHE